MAYMESFGENSVTPQVEVPRMEDSIENLETLLTEREARIVELETLLAERDEHINYLEKQVGIDELTGVSNRRGFMRELEESLHVINQEVNNRREDEVVFKQFSLITLDIDHFKKVNDTYGHPVGDNVLRKVSLYLMESMRDTDVVARIGGEEFVMLLRGVDEVIAKQNAEQFRLHIEELVFENYPDLKVTASFGVISSKLSTDATTLLSLVDKALYNAKTNGRNRVVVHR